MNDQPTIIQGDPEILCGTPVFRGTREPIQTLHDYLDAGDSIDEFLVGFPAVSREQALALFRLRNQGKA